MWSRIDALTEPNGYEMFGVLAFLEHVPDRARAETAFERVGPLLLSSRARRARPRGGGRDAAPLAFAPLPGSIARRLFDAGTSSRRTWTTWPARSGDDGGWMFNWPSWSPAAEADWRGFLTVDALRVLRANGRA